MLGSASFTPTEAKGLKIEVNGLHRDASGVTTLVWTLRNESGSSMTIGSRFDNYRSLAVSNVNTASGLELVDTTGKLRYQPMRASDNRCLCNEFIRLGAKSQIGRGETATFADLYKLPPELRTVDLRVPWSGSPGATVADLTVR